jgi:hypothetical protein
MSYALQMIEVSPAKPIGLPDSVKTSSGVD